MGLLVAAWRNCATGLGIIILVLIGALISQMPFNQPKPTGLHYPKTFHIIPCGTECNK